MNLHDPSWPWPGAGFLKHTKVIHKQQSSYKCKLTKCPEYPAPSLLVLWLHLWYGYYFSSKIGALVNHVMIAQSYLKLRCSLRRYFLCWLRTNHWLFYCDWLNHSCRVTAGAMFLFRSVKPNISPWATIINHTKTRRKGRIWRVLAKGTYGW